MSFLRHREIFRSDVIRSVRERLHRRPRPHRLDEFPVGYSSAGCTPALPASASPTDPHSALKSSCRSSAFHQTVNSVLTACLSSGGHPKELASALQLIPGETLLDLGCGLGGPARYLAAIHGVHVTGIDLTPEFIEVSDYLSGRCGLADKLKFVNGDATELHFPLEHFDQAWTQHVAMNIPDKQALYAGVYRVLKPGGAFAIYDAVLGGGQPVLYPTPWAREAGISFLATEQEVQEALRSAGFSIVSSVDQSEIAARWFREMQAQQAEAKTAGQLPNPLSASAILGPELGPAVANFARNVLEDRVRILQVIAKKQ